MDQINLDGVMMNANDAIYELIDNGIEIIYSPDDCPGYGYGLEPFCTTIDRAFKLADPESGNWKSTPTVSEYKLKVEIDEDGNLADSFRYDTYDFTGRYWEYHNGEWIEY